MRHPDVQPERFKEEHTVQVSDDELREKLVDSIDDRRFDDNFPGGLSFDAIVYSVEHLLPVIRNFTATAVEEAVREAGNEGFVDGFYQGMKRVAGNALIRLKKDVEVADFLQGELDQAERRIAELNRTEGETES